MRKSKLFINGIFILMLVLTALGNTAMVARADNQDPKIDPNLLQLANDHPDYVFPVIVQKELKNKDLPDDDPETAVEKANGKVNREKKMDFIASFSAELTGREIEKLAKNPKVRWVSLDAPLFSTAIVKSTVADGFSAVSFSGNTGNQNWSNAWQELGDADGPGAGIVLVGTQQCSTGYCLVINSSGTKNIQDRGVSRQVDLSHAASATLSFSYRRANSTGTTGSVRVQVSANGGTAWSTLATYDLNASDSSYVAQSFDISSYIAPNTQVRFIGAGTANRVIAFDNIQIEYSVSTSFNYPPMFSTVRDEFLSASFSLNNGTQAWASNWIESDTKGIGTGTGNIGAPASSNCASGAGNCLYVYNLNPGDNIYREVNLSGATSASLTLWRNNLLSGLNNNDSVVLEVSTDGANWTVLRTWRDVTQDVGTAYEQFDLTPYIGAATRIRFRVATHTNNSAIYFDNIQIEYTRLTNTYNQTVGADKLWKKPPFLDGQGVTIAVVDSGINTHSDLQVTGGGNSRLIASTTVRPGTPADDYGHGTHVAGVITGNGAANSGARIGVAPGANLINVKVSDSTGMSLGSDLVAGLQWVYDNRLTYNIKVVNISLNSTVAESYHTSPIDAAVEVLWFNGIVVVVSAGNNGGPGALYPPANDPFVITVGAADDLGTASISDDVVAAFSAYGTTEDGFAKPDLVAPGRNMISLNASTNSNIYNNRATHRVDNNYFRMSGTSMSAPVVTGAVALLLQDEPNLNPDQVKYRLMSTANKSWAGYNATTAGAGYLDAYAAVNGTSTQSANTGLYASQMLSTGSEPITWGSVGWNSVGWNSVGWNSVGWNSVGWNSVGWNSVGWNSDYWGP